MSGQSRLYVTAACLLVLTAAVARPEPQPKKEPPSDEQALKAARVGVDAPELFEFLRKRIPTDEDRKQAARLIEALRDDMFATRQKASVDLVALGAAARPQLRQAALDPDEEVRERARDAVEAIDKA